MTPSSATEAASEDLNSEKLYMHAGGELVQSTTMATVYGGVDSIVPAINMSDVMNQGVIDKLQEPMESTITVLAATASAA